MQRALILKELELKEVKEDMRINAAVINAISNANRGKNKPFKKLWKKKKGSTTVNPEKFKTQIKDILELEKEQGKDWVDLIYQANGIERRINE